MCKVSKPPGGSSVWDVLLGLRSQGFLPLSLLFLRWQVRWRRGDRGPTANEAQGSGREGKTAPSRAAFTVERETEQPPWGWGDRTAAEAAPFLHDATARTEKRLFASFKKLEPHRAGAQQLPRVSLRGFGNLEPFASLGKGLGTAERGARGDGARTFLTTPNCPRRPPRGSALRAVGIAQ